MSTLGPSLQQSIEWLVISVPLLTREGENKIVKACVMNLSLVDIKEVVILISSSVEVSSTFESVGFKLQAKQGVES